VECISRINGRHANKGHKQEINHGIKTGVNLSRNRENKGHTCFCCISNTSKCVEDGTNKETIIRKSVKELEIDQRNKQNKRLKEKSY